MFWIKWANINQNIISDNKNIVKFEEDEIIYESLDEYFEMNIYDGILDI